jgi:uncharacterized protein
MNTFELRTATGRCIARSVRMACSFRSRCVGLLSRGAMLNDEGLLMIPGGSIHTLGMRFPIDVVFLSRQMCILGLAEHVQPWRIRVAPRGTRRVLELASGQIAAHGLKSGIYLIVDRDSPNPPDRSERITIKMPPMRIEPCNRQPIQFSLRLPLERCVGGAVRGKCVTDSADHL